MFKFFLVVTFLFSFCSQASLVFNESTDLSEDLLFPTNISNNLSLGDNYVFGTVDYLRGDFYDSFKVNVLNSHKITKILFQAFDVKSSVPDYRIAWGFISIYDNVFGATGLNFFHEDSSNILSEMSTSSDSNSHAFDLSHRTFAALSGASHFDYMNKIWDLYPADSGTSSYSWKYTFTVENVSQVPVPPSIALFIFAILAIYRKGQK